MNFEDRQTKRTPLPPTDEELAAFTEWKAEYEKLEDLGIAAGWLRGGHYEPYWVGEPRPSGYEERLETDEEYDRRMNSPMARVHWMLSQVYLGDIETTTAIKRLELPEDLDYNTRGGHVIFPVHTRKTFGQ